MSDHEADNYSYEEIICDPRKGGVKSFVIVWHDRNDWTVGKICVPDELGLSLCGHCRRLKLRRKNDLGIWFNKQDEPSQMILETLCHA